MPKMTTAIRRRSARKLLLALPLVPALALWWRRRQRREHVSRILPTVAAVHRHYGISAAFVLEPEVYGQAATLTTLRNARIIAQPVAVIGADWSLLWPYSTQLQRRPEGHNVIWREHGPTKTLAGRSLHATVDGFSYYHWLTGTLPKLLLAKRARHDLRDFDHLIVNPKHKGKDNFQTQTLALLDAPMERVTWIDRGAHLRCDEIVLPSEPCVAHQTVIEEWALALLRETFLPIALSHEVPKGPARLFVSRALARRRRLVNEDEIYEVLRPLGYERVALEELPVLTQARWFAEASDIVALHGAGLSNLVFATGGAQVVEIGTTAWRNPCFRNLASEAKLRYACILGRPSGWRDGFAADVTVDVSKVKTIMEKMR